jgi:hypothetical protein
MGRDTSTTITKKQIEEWRQQVKEERQKLFADLKFDKFGRKIKEAL